MQASINQLIDKLPTLKGKYFIEAFRHGSMFVELYKPDKVDLQQPHIQDELYIIVSGSGMFKNGEINETFQALDVLFVPAGVEHRFYNFSDDFATWVIFYGLKGGEAGQIID